jgi:hypothetical protein
MNPQPMPGQHRVATLVADPAARAAGVEPAQVGARRSTGWSPAPTAGPSRSRRARSGTR